MSSGPLVECIPGSEGGTQPQDGFMRQPWCRTARGKGAIHDGQQTHWLALGRAVSAGGSCAEESRGCVQGVGALGGVTDTLGAVFHQGLTRSHHAPFPVHTHRLPLWTHRHKHIPTVRATLILPQADKPL